MPIVLIIFGIILIFVNIKAINTNNNSFKDVLKYKEKDISKVELDIAQIRKDVAESLTELQTEIVKINEAIASGKEIKGNKKDSIKNREDKNNSDFKKLLDQNQDVINDINTKGKTERIRELLEQGLSEDEICNMLSLGKGEVLLVKGLYKK